MTQNEARVAILLRLKNLSILSDPEKDLNENISYKYVVDNVADAWVRLTIRFNGRNQQTLGGKGVPTKYKRVGIATVQVFTSINTGEYDNDELCRVIEAEFTEQTGDYPLYYGGDSAGGDVRVDTIGRSDSWWQQNVVIPFWYWECVT